MRNPICLAQCDTERDYREFLEFHLRYNFYALAISVFNERLFSKSLEIVCNRRIRSKNFHTLCRNRNVMKNVAGSIILWELNFPMKIPNLIGKITLKDK